MLFARWAVDTSLFATIIQDALCAHRCSFYVNSVTVLLSHVHGFVLVVLSLSQAVPAHVALVSGFLSTLGGQVSSAPRSLVNNR